MRSAMRETGVRTVPGAGSCDTTEPADSPGPAASSTTRPKSTPSRSSVRSAESTRCRAVRRTPARSGMTIAGSAIGGHGHGDVEAEDRALAEVPRELRLEPGKLGLGIGKITGGHRCGDALTLPGAAALDGGLRRHRDAGDPRLEGTHRDLRVGGGDDALARPHQLGEAELGGGVLG